MNREIENMRESYERGALSKETTPDQPIELFSTWFDDAKNAQVTEPNAMTLATANLNGKPSARIILLKGFNNEGFIFYTNYQSRKAEELAKNPQAALLFLWLETERQVRIEGVVRKISEEESLAYYQSRPRGSQIGAIASDQSRPIENREALDQKLSDIEVKFASVDPIPKPSHWGGYILKAEYIEFWQGRQSRMHDRIVYQREGETWQKTRLQP